MPPRPWSAGKGSSKHGHSPVSEKEGKIVDVNLKRELDAHQSKSPFSHISGAFGRRLKKVGSQSSIDRFPSPPRNRVESHASSGSFKSEDSARTSMRHQRSFHNTNGSVTSNQPQLRHANSFHPTTPPKGFAMVTHEPAERPHEEKRLKPEMPGIRKRLFSGGSKDRGPRLTSKGDKNEVISLSSMRSDPSTNGDMSFTSSMFDNDPLPDDQDNLKSMTFPVPQSTYDPRKENYILHPAEIARMMNEPPSPILPPSPPPPEPEMEPESPSSDFAPLPLSPPPRRRNTTTPKPTLPISMPSRSPSITKSAQSPPPPPSIRPSASTETFLSLRPAPRRLSAIPRKASITSTHSSSHTVSTPPTLNGQSSSSLSGSRNRAGSTSSRHSLRKQRGLSKKPSFLSLDDDDEDEFDNELGLSPSREEHDEDSSFSTSHNKRLLNEPLGPRDSVELVDDSFFDFGGRGHSFETIGGSQGSY